MLDNFEGLRASGNDINEMLLLIAQKTKKTLEELARARIQKGRRIVQGQTARGLRQDLTKEDVKSITKMMSSKPATEKAAEYKNKIPNYEVSLDDEVLFRQEQDGRVTTNEVQLESEQVAENFTYKDAFSVDWDPEIEENSLDQKFVEIEAKYLKQSDIDYDFDPWEEELENGDSLAQLPEQDELDSDLDGLSNALEIAQGTNPFDADTDGDGINDAADNDPNNPSAHQEQDLTKPTSFELDNIPEAVRVSERDAQKLPEGKGKQLLKGIVEGVKERAKSIAEKIKNYPQWQRDQKAANTVVKLFKENYEQTGETRYEGIAYDISLKGLNNYEVSDKQGNSLLKFEKKALGAKVSESNLSVNDYSQFQLAQRSLSNKSQKIMKADSEQRLAKLQKLAPQRDNEIVSAFQTKGVVDTANKFLHYMGVDKWDAGKRGNYNIEKAGNDIRITSKADGRGIVFERRQGKITNNLKAKDFRHFKDLDKTLEKQVKQVKSQQQQTAPKKEQKVARERELSI